MIEYILLTGIGIGCIIGICIKTFFCRELPVIYETTDTDTDTDNDSIESNKGSPGYIKYLEKMLNNSTEVTTNSFRLNSVEANCNNITDDYIEPCLNDLDTTFIDSSTSSLSDPLSSIIPSAPPLSPEIPTAFVCNIIPFSKN
jgi:hypothetical protein